MRTLSRNKQKFWYCLYSGVETVTDANGNETGKNTTYSAPKQMCANISPAAGRVQTEQFGNLANYDKVIVTTDMNCPIDENTVLFIDKVPEYRGSTPLYDYIVRRVSKSINSITIAVRKVNVS